MDETELLKQRTNEHAVWRDLIVEAWNRLST